MATTYGMTTPMVSSVMPNPTGMSQPTMTGQSPMAMTSPMMTANMNLPLSTARPIDVTETTPNLEQIQSFEVVGRAVDGTHFHQDPVTGQMYRMSEEFHQRISDILSQKDMYMNFTITDLVENDGILELNSMSSHIDTSKQFYTSESIGLGKSKVQFNDISTTISNNLITSNKEVLKKYEIENTSILNNFVKNENIDVISNDRSITFNVLEVEKINISNKERNKYITPVNLFKNNSMMGLKTETSPIQKIAVYFIPINSFRRTPSSIILNRNSFQNNYMTLINKFTGFNNRN